MLINDTMDLDALLARMGTRYTLADAAVVRDHLCNPMQGLLDCSTDFLTDKEWWAHVRFALSTEALRKRNAEVLSAIRDVDCEFYPN